MMNPCAASVLRFTGLQVRSPAASTLTLVLRLSLLLLPKCDEVPYTIVEVLVLCRKWVVPVVLWAMTILARPELRCVTRVSVLLRLLIMVTPT